MLRIPVVALGLSLGLCLAGCSPPQEAPKAEEVAAPAVETPVATEAPKAEIPAPEPPPPPPPAPKPKPKPKPVEHVSAPAPAPAPVCQECGVVASVDPISEKGAGSGAGAVLGAIAGGVIGHQFGGGKGKKIATAAGAIGGGFAGHEAEKRIRTTSAYQVGVNMENGTFRTVRVVDAAGFSPGTRVRVVGDSLQVR